ncbi:MAG: DUF2057 domain-containing protein [Kangiellaceae bacterium]|nr:DUF2057 domain-containing protein [Kangiellaceae bacterium]
MNLLKLFLIAITAICTEIALASPSITFAREFNIRAINGVEYSSGLIDQDRKVSLRKGLNRIVLEFEEVYEGEDNDDFDVVKSGWYLLQIRLDDKPYVQKITRPADASAAKKYIKNPIFEIVDHSTNTRLNYKLSPIASDKLDYAISKSRLRQNDAILISHPATKSASINTHKNSLSVSQSTASQMLDYWWQQATPQEREAFLRKVKKK